jgi:DNA-binding NarL/FixJ family response regulator
MSIKIILADDHRIMREGLRVLLEKESDMEVVAEADNGQRTVQLARELSPDVVIMDITMPDLNGIEATRQVIHEVPGTKVVALSMHSDEQFVAGMLGAGALGYVLKDCAIEELCSAVRAVIANQTYLSPAISEVVVKDYLSRLSKNKLVPELSKREGEVLQLVAEGKTSKEIAAILNLSAKTISTYRRQIMHKLDIHSVAELTKYAIRRGITSLPN